MKTKQWILIVLVAMLAMACSDQTNKTHTITGKLLFKNSMLPMGDVAISIYQDNGKDGFQLEILGETVLTAADGGFAFDIQPYKNEEASDIILSAGANTQFNLAFSQQNFTLPILFHRIDPALVLEDEVYTEDVLGDAFGFLEVEFRGNTELFPGDAVTLTVKGDGYEYQSPFQLGDDLSKIYTYPVLGNVKTNVSWESKFGGIEKQDADSVFCPNRENTRFRVNL